MITNSIILQKTIMRWLTVLMIPFLLNSCSAQWHLKRAVKKDPTILVEDTLVVKDTVVVPPVVITDTVTTKQHDTIIVEKDRLKVKNRKEAGHSYYRRSMRLGYDSEDH